MISHVVLFRPRADLPAGDAQAFAASFEHAVREIPSVRRVLLGRRIRFGRAYEQMMPADFPYLAVIEFDDLAGLQCYLDHPAHAEAGRRLFETVEAALVYDFETAAGADAIRALIPRASDAPSP